jgi:hypothetical protein
MIKHSWPNIFRRIDWAFIGLVSALLAINVPLLLGIIRPILDTHYAFNAFYLVYNDFFFNGELPMWEPYGRYGVQAYYPMLTALSPSSIFVGFVGWALRVRDVSFLFNLSLFLEQLIFLYGTYLLSRGLFRHKTTVVFVCLSAALSTVLVYQIWFNFRVYSMLPLVLHFGLRFFSNYRLRDLGFAMTLFVVSLIGLVPYMVEILALELAIIALVMVASNIRNLGNVLKSPRSDAVQGVTLLIFSAVTVLAYYYLLVESVKLVENLGIGRDPMTHQSELHVFLTHGGAVGFIKFIELFIPVLKLSGSAFTLYIGLIPLAFLLYGLTRPNILVAVVSAAVLVLGTGLLWVLVTYGASSSPALHPEGSPGALVLKWLLPLVALALLVYIFRRTGNVRITAFAAVVVILTLFSLGDKTFVAEALYGYFPLMKYFRHIGYVVGNFKLFLPLLAGFGLDSFLAQTSREGDVPGSSEDSFSYATVGIALLVALGSAIYLIVANFNGANYEYFQMSTQLFVWVTVLSPALTALYVVAMLWSRKRMSFRTHFSVFLIVGVCFQMFGFQVLQNYDSYQFSKKMKMTYSRESVFVRKYGFQKIRELLRPASRPELFEATLLKFSFSKVPNNYAIAYNLIQWDPCIPSLKMDYINSYVADLIRLNKGVARELMITAPGDLGFYKAAGCIAPKLRLIQDVVFAGSDEESGNLTKAVGIEDKLVLTGVPGEVRQSWEGANPASGGGTIEVVSFSANELVVEAEVPEGKGTWLYYADAWHPGWKAFINGRPAHVARANHAFKAVMLLGGKSEVRFIFDGGLGRHYVHFFAALSIVFVVAVLACMVCTVFRRGSAEQ